MAHILIWVVVGLGTILGALIVAIVVRRATAAALGGPAAWWPFGRALSG